jgi:hypothetical protein
MKFVRVISFLQGLYYVITGGWPVVHLQSFMSFTGTKTDGRLVKAMGLLFVAIGIGLMINQTREKGIVIIALLTPLFMAITDIYYATAGRISNVYYIDAMAEVVIMILWLIALLSPMKKQLKTGHFKK